MTDSDWTQLLKERNRRAQVYKNLGMSFETLARHGFRVTHNYRDGVTRMAKPVDKRNVPSGELFVFLWGAYASSPILTFEEVRRYLDRKSPIIATIGEPQSI